jgi:D-methionine transport system ATP-binding protein
LADSPPLLTLDQVSFTPSLGSEPVLHAVSFEVQSGDRLVIVGPSGAGKTMLLQLLNRLRDPTTGRILLSGQDLQQIPIRQVRQRVVLVAQESSLLGMTVQEALAYPLQLRRLDQPAQRQRIATWMEQLHIPSNWLDRTEAQLSVGQRQLVAIARGLVTQPEVIVLDEPTSALDAGRSHHLATVLTNVAAQGITVVMVNHQLEIAAAIATHIMQLDQGKRIQFTDAALTDWSKLKASLVEAEQRHAEEWELL